MKANLKWIAVVLLACAASSCSPTHNQKANNPAANSAPASLVGTEWVLRDVAGTPALDKPEATLAFLEAGRAAGSGSCNRFNGSVEISGSAIKFGPLASTHMACMENGIGNQEDRYLKILQSANRYEIQGEKLLIYGEENAKPLVFSRPATSKP